MHHFNVDVPSFGLLGGLSVALTALGIFYDRVRGDANLSAMLFGTAFLCAFSPSIDILNYFLLTVAGPRADMFFAHIDRALGFDWPSLMLWTAAHPTINAVLRVAYESSLSQIALLVVCLAWTSHPREIYSLCIALAVAGMVAVAIWTIAPSFGAFSVYRLPPAVAAHMPLALDGKYADQLIALLQHGPDRIAPDQLRGLIGFPSFHSVLAILVMWYAWPLRYLRWPALALNTLVLLSTPVQGGHHLVDVMGGLVLAAASIALAERITRMPVRQTVAASAMPEVARA
jgi:membrane-associated phospholipid phosphatase